MSLRRKIHRLLPVLPVLPGWTEEEGVIPLDEMRRLLEMERARAERTGQEFSLLTFVLPGGDEGRRVLPRLAAALFKRVRAIDTVGWLDESQIAVLLPETPPPGAHLLGEEIVDRLAVQGWTVSCKVCAFSKVCRPWTGPRGRAGTDGLVDGPLTGTGLAAPEGDEPLEPLFAVRLPLWKRAADLIVSAAGLTVLWPLMLLVSLAVKLSSPGPAIFRQERVGRAGRTFAFLKFRTMHTGNDPSGHRSYVTGLIDSDLPMNKIEDDPRTFPLGRLLRKTSLDELPQLINVLRGEMSLVGPRPCLPYEAAEYSRWHARRFDLLPGMTGLWQVSGKNDRTFREMIRLDLAYARSLSPWRDLKILFLTPLAVLGGLGGAKSEPGIGERLAHEQSA
jgi:lipopolysaccharide/colanic/teichoic acid biosynthesis glycosyltransferase